VGFLVNPARIHLIALAESGQAWLCFDYQRLSDFFAQLQVERVKGIINTNTGWFIINGTEQSIDYILTTMPVS
jgi:hypothetical protein